MFRAVIYDLDGMLLRGTRFSEVYRNEFGIPEETMHAFFDGGPFEECILGRADLKQVLNDNWLRLWKWSSTAEELLEYWFKTGNTFDAEIADTIPVLRRKGVLCVLATNNEKYRMAHVRNAYGLDAFFDRIFCSSEMGCKKPDAEFFDSIMQYFGSEIRRENVLFWDDRLRYVESANNYGFSSFLYSTPREYMNVCREKFL